MTSVLYAVLIVEAIALVAAAADPWIGFPLTNWVWPK